MKNISKTLINITFIAAAAAIIAAAPAKASNLTLNEQLGCDRLLELSATAANDAMECDKVKERVNGDMSRCFLYGVGIYALNLPTGIVAAPKEIRKAVIKACIMLTHDISEAKAEQALPEIFAMFEHSSFLEENELYAEIGRSKAKLSAEMQRKKNAVTASEEAKVQALPVNQLLMNEGMCREALMDLFKRSPIPLQSNDKPQ